SFVQWVTERLRRNEKTNVVIDQYNNPTFADSLVEVIFRLFDLDKNGTFHVTGKECISRYEFAKAISRKFSLNEKLLNPITTAELNQVARRPEKLNMKVDKVERITGIKMLNVNEGLDRLIMQMGK
ncbi:MAG: sugar nucleotide-binding protein, partial [Nitrososphaeria archaeon]